MTDLKDYLRYFQEVANEHTDLRDFYIMDINEVLTALRSEAKFPMLILHQLTGSLQAKNLDNPLDMIKGGFLVIDQLANVDDFEAEMDTIDRMKKIAFDIVARMLHDVWKCEPLALKSLPGFDVNSVKYEQMDQVFDNGFGVLVTFDLIDTVDLQYNPLKWDANKEIPGKNVY